MNYDLLKKAAEEGGEVQEFRGPHTIESQEAMIRMQFFVP